MADSERLILSTSAKGSRKNSVSHTSGKAITARRPKCNRLIKPAMRDGIIMGNLLSATWALAVQHDSAMIFPINVHAILPGWAVTAPLGVGHAHFNHLPGSSAHVVK